MMSKTARRTDENAKMGFITDDHDTIVKVRRREN